MQHALHLDAECRRQEVIGLFILKVKFENMTDAQCDPQHDLNIKQPWPNIVASWYYSFRLLGCMNTARALRGKRGLNMLET